MAVEGNVSFELNEAEEVRLAVYDVLGRQVVVLKEGRNEAGPHTVRLDASGLAAGVYALRLTAGARAVSRLLTIVRP